MGGNWTPIRVAVAVPSVQSCEQVAEAIQRICAECGCVAVPIEPPRDRREWPRVRQQLESADLVIADFTGTDGADVPDPAVVAVATLALDAFRHEVWIIANAFSDPRPGLFSHIRYLAYGPGRRLLDDLVRELHQALREFIAMRGVEIGVTPPWAEYADNGNSADAAADADADADADTDDDGSPTSVSQRPTIGVEPCIEPPVDGAGALSVVMPFGAPPIPASIGPSPVVELPLSGNGAGHVERPVVAPMPTSRLAGRVAVQPKSGDDHAISERVREIIDSPPRPRAELTPFRIMSPLSPNPPATPTAAEFSAEPAEPTVESSADEMAVEEMPATPGVVCLVAIAAHRGTARALAVHPETERAIIGGHDAVLGCFDVSSGSHIGQSTATHHRGAIMDVDFDRLGYRAISVGVDGFAQVWDLHDSEMRHSNTFRVHGSGCQRVRVLPMRSSNLRALTAGNDGTILKWNLTRCEISDRWRGHTGPVTGLALTHDGRFALSGGSDARLIVWDVGNGQSVRTITRAHDDPIHSLALSPTGEFAITATSSSCKLWNLGRAEEIGRLDTHDGPVLAVCFMRGHRFAVTAGMDGQITVWETHRHDHPPTVFPAHRSPVTALAAIDDRRLASIGSDGHLRVWHLTLPLDSASAA